MKIMLPAGYAGKLGYASAGALADFIMVNMVAEAASGGRDAQGEPSVPLLGLRHRAAADGRA